MKNSWGDKFNVIPFIDGASDTEETGEEGRDQARCTDPLNCIVSLRCVTRSTV